MSSTRQHGDRRPLDAYYTPADLAHELVRLLPIAPGECVWEPHAGQGAFVEALVQSPAGVVYRSDIVDRGAVRLDHVGDFLQCPAIPASGDWSPDWIVGNPPFSRPETRNGSPTGRRNKKGRLIMEPAASLHIEHALQTTGRHVAFLLRLAMLESKRRVPMWKRWPLRKVWVLPRRPSFTDGGTDSCPYGWFWFDKEHTGSRELGWTWEGA